MGRKKKSQIFQKDCGLGKEKIEDAKKKDRPKGGGAGLTISKQNSLPPFCVLPGFLPRNRPSAGKTRRPPRKIKFHPVYSAFDLQNLQFSYRVRGSCKLLNVGFIKNPKGKVAYLQTNTKWSSCLILYQHHQYHTEIPVHRDPPSCLIDLEGFVLF